MTIIDSHHHVWDLSVRDRAWLQEEQSWADADSMARLRRSFTMADLEPLADAAGVGATVVVQTEIGPAETPELLALAAERKSEKTIYIISIFISVSLFF